MGDAGHYTNGASLLWNRDISVSQNGASISMHLKIGDIINGSEQANKILFVPSQDEIPEDEKVYTIYIDQKHRPSANNTQGGLLSDKLESVRQVEFNDINFDRNEVGEIRIGGDTVENDFSFRYDISSIEAMVIRQGHFNQPSDILVDNIRVG